MPSVLGYFLKIELAFEQKLLLALSASTVDASPYAEEVRRAQPQIDWAAFRRLAARHRVGALIHSNLDQLPALEIPDDLRIWLKNCLKKNAFDYMRAVHIANDITGALKAAGISCSLMKGCSIAAQFYAQPSHRAMIDIDLLVERERYYEAERLLIERGFKRLYPLFDLDDRKRETFYRLHNAFTFVRPTDGLQIDLHWRTVSNPVLLPFIDLEWRELVEWRDDTGRSLPTLTGRAHFIYVMVHGAKHGWVRLKWLVDLDKMVRGLSGEACNDVARQISANGLGVLAQASLDLAHRCLGTPIPSAFKELGEIKPARRITQLQARMLLGEEPASPHQLRDWRYYLNRIRHSFLLHRGKTYRRHAMAIELARPADLELISVAPQRWWLLAFLSPLLGVWRGFRNFALKSD
ncbi:nucleotidyltransferase family protein [Altererythrobacter sp. RZ02]|uniref:Nucleotidyltransferase family protein n=1 Tax=Pontixanthobacter rizhaonensis TaxID=2730337 RepID=A0A848QH48_9SPHN|nr:nucleotidyltransferase family protein [Pontixanthobacter rizhaonensis]NMW31952.1 nucleotidyltransferase family protein [Pontixanthobacter rizhaonensis]